MKLKLEKRTLLLISIMVVLVILSMTIYFVVGNNLVRRVLFFPGRNTSSGEMRHVPKQEYVEENIELFINELILGPYSIDHLRLIPEKTKLQGLLLRNKSFLFIDFSADLIVSEQELSINTAKILELIKKNLMYNFPILEEISLSVDGQTLQMDIN